MLSYSRAGKLRTAMRVLNLMQKDGCAPDLTVCNAAIQVLVMAGRLAKAVKFSDRMERVGIKPNIITYNSLIKGSVVHSFCQSGRMEEAKNIVTEMISKGCLPDVVTYSAVIDGFCRIGKIDQARKMLKYMYKNNYAAKMDSSPHRPRLIYFSMHCVKRVTWERRRSSWRSVKARNDRFEEATELAKKMLHRGLVPTPVMYRTVIHRYCEKGKVEELLKLLEKMLQRKELRSAYNQVIEKLCALGKPEEAYKILGKVLRTASKIDGQTCHILMESSLRSGLPLQSYEVACRMFQRNLIPDVKVCQKVKDRLVLEGHANHGEKLMTKFVERGLLSPQNQ
uniref:Pentatricopeptide repeat-containing protein n=1 Tax=Ananas comosus var. bracteatus TaxID=296719 RepID=A0A6V7QEL4_ANACO|nr:unnamed protein product [Ananas comosus var. bracteatus]